MDIFILGGTRLEGALLARPIGSTKIIAMETFTDVTDKAGLREAGWAYGVCVGDYNNDGNEDLFCTYLGQKKLYRNNGHGTFTDVTRQAGLLSETSRFGTGCSFVDYNRDGHVAKCAKLKAGT